MITFSSDATGGTVDNAEAVIHGGFSANGHYYVSTEGIAAKDLGDTIYFRVYARLADGSYVYGAPVSCSPKTYANTILNGDYSVEMKTLVVAMLNYGAAAQTYFNYKTDDLVNSDLTDAQKALVEDRADHVIPAVGIPSIDKQGAFLGNGVYVAAVYESEGVTYCTGVLPYSIADYCSNARGEEQALANATVIYGCTAKEFFNA